MGKQAWIAGAILTLCCANARADDVSRVEALLSAGIEPSGAHDAISSLGEAGELALWQLYERPSTVRYVRLRALNELSRFHTALTAQGFSALVRDAASSPVVLRRALDGLIALAPDVKPPLAASELTFALEHRDAHVRKAASQLLALLDDGDALLERFSTDRSAMVRASALRARAVRITNQSAVPTSPR